MQTDEMLTPNEVADLLRVPTKTVWRWCRNETLPAVKIGKYWRIPRDELVDFIKSHKAQGRRQIDEGESISG